jgi:hypothetical protein
VLPCGRAEIGSTRLSTVPGHEKVLRPFVRNT